MVFNFRCFSMGDVAQESESVDNFVTAHSQFHPGPAGSAPVSRDTDYISSGVPGLNGRSSSLRVFTLAELKKATKNFDESTKIGQGGFGSVHLGIVTRAEHPFDDIRVAVKRGKKGVKRQWQTEVDFLGMIEHENLVKLIGYCYEEHLDEESNWFLVYEYMPNRSLDYHLTGTSNKPLPWPVRLKIARDAAVGLNYLHEGSGLNVQIIFRDFKPSNVLLDENWNAKLSDFGLVREGPREGRTHVSTLVVGTKRYAAPEYIQTGRLTYKSDVWSYGIFLEELITGKPPPARKNPVTNPECMRWACCSAGAGKSDLQVDPRIEGTYTSRSMQKISSIADKCLAKNPTLRPTMSEVLEMVKEAITFQNQQPL